MTDSVDGSRASVAPHWLGTFLYIPLLLGAGWLISRPLILITPNWRSDQHDLCGLVIALVLFLATLPRRIRRVWGCSTPWTALGLAVPRAKARKQAAHGSRLAGLLLFVTTVALLISSQADWKPRLDLIQLAEALALGVGVGFAEELLFRGWLLGELSLRMSQRHSQILQAVVYAGVHPWYRESGLEKVFLLSGLLVLGLMLGLLKRADDGSLWGPIALHGTLVGGWSVVQNDLISISSRSSSWWTGPGSATDVNPIGGLLGLTALSGLYLLLRRRSLGRQTLAHLVMIQRNEGALLRTWVHYHASLFGYNSLTILDHGSTCRHTIQHLREAERLGASVIRLRYSDLDFNEKGKTIEATIKADNRSKLAFPMDCDEFICLDRGSELSCNPTHIKCYLRSLQKERIFKARRRLNNAPWNHTTFLPMPDSRPGKVFMSTMAFTDLDTGSHSCRSPRKTLESEISYIHLHNKPYAFLRSSAEAKLIAYGVDISSISTLQQYSGPGWHLCRYLIEPEADWQRSLRQQTRLTSKAFAKRLRQIGLPHPFPG